MPGWRNGLRRGLKILDPKGFVGSNPTPGTNVSNKKRAYDPRFDYMIEGHYFVSYFLSVSKVESISVAI
jgi:hypothetical protein